MKRKVALLLAAVMTTAMLPMNAVASSTNQISKKETVQKDKAVSPSKPVALKIYPKDTVESDSTIILTLENGKFDIKEWNEQCEENGLTQNNFYYGRNNGTSTSNAVFDEAWNSYKSDIKGGSPEATAIKTALAAVGVTGSNNYLPYSIDFKSKSTADVKLFPVLEAYTDNTSNDLGVTAKVCYNIVLPIVATSEGDVKVSVDSNGTSISGGGTYTVATATSSSGSTTTTIDADDIKSFENKLVFDDETVVIKEDVAGTFDTSKGNVKLRLNSGFEFSTNTYNGKTVYAVVTPGTNSPDFEPLLITSLDKENQLSFDLADLKDEDGNSVFATETTKAAAIQIEKLAVVAKDDDKNWGDVNLTVSGGSITTDTIKIATRADYGFYMKAVEEPTTIIAGQTYLANDDLDADDFETAELMFGETIADTWIQQRKLEFTVPEGVKILGFDIDDTDNINGGDNFLGGSDKNLTSVVNDGRTLRIEALDGTNTIDSTDESEFGITFWISAAATFEGDVTVDVAGAGLAADTLSPVTVATVKAPVTVETTATKANMGYQSMDTSDIVITESVANALLEDENVSIALDSSYGSQEIGFADDDLELVVDGELEYENFKIGKGYYGVTVSDDQIDGTDKDTAVEGAITFGVDSASYTEPSTITVKNVKIGTTRAVPYGTYDLKIGDEAVINNYSEDLDQPSKSAVYSGDDTPADQNLALFDGSKDDAIYVKDYLSIATETGTLDGKVEVTIGESKIVMNGEEVEMDAAAYISNNSTMVPLRFVALAIGVDQANASSVEAADASSKIMFDTNSKTATILYAAGSGQKIIQFTAGSAIMNVDGTAITMENGAVAEIKDDRMYVPFRALGTALGVSVSWDEETRTAIYNA
jgi:hypothetical protein